MRDPFEVLGLTAGVSEAEVLAAYRTLVRRYHPDRYVGESEAVRAEAERRMAEVTGAYQLLRDPLALARFRAQQRRRAGASRGHTQRPPADGPTRPSERRSATPPPGDQRRTRHEPFDYRTAAASEFDHSSRRPSPEPYAHRVDRLRTPQPRADRQVVPPMKRSAGGIRDGIALIATGAAVVVATVVVAAVVVAGVRGQPSSQAGIPVSLSGPVNAMRLEVGDCFDDVRVEANPDGHGTVRSVRRMECGAPHESEVVGIVTLDAAFAGAYPGASTITAYAGPRCEGAYSTTLGVPYRPGLPVGLWLIYPSEASWSQRPHNVVCSVRSVEGSALSAPARELL